MVRKAKLQDPKVVEYLNQYPAYSFTCTQILALDSNDHLEPESTFEGTVSRPEFVLACGRIIEKDKLNFLDFGCGSGALVFDFLARGHFAIGLDGSDAAKTMDYGYWNFIKHLHNCDVTKAFGFFTPEKKKIKFDIVSMWEVFEHVPETQCGLVLQNIRENLNDDGLFVGLISLLEYVNQHTGVPYHVTLKEKTWWTKLFSDYGLEIVDSDFRDFEYCRRNRRQISRHSFLFQRTSQRFSFRSQKSVN